MYFLTVRFWNNILNFGSTWGGRGVFAWRDSYRETTHNVNKILFDARFQPLLTPVEENRSSVLNFKYQMMDHTLHTFSLGP